MLHRMRLFDWDGYLTANFCLEFSKPFLQAEELDATREKYKVIQRVLLVKGPSVPENQKTAVAEGIAEQKEIVKAFILSTFSLSTLSFLILSLR